MSDKMIEQMNKDNEEIQQFSATLGAELTRENIHEAREKGLIIVHVGKRFLQVAGKTNAIFDLSREQLSDVESIHLFFNDNNSVFFVIKPYKEIIQERPEYEKYRHIEITKEKFQFNTEIPFHTPYTRGIVF